MSYPFLPWNASKARLRDAEKARQNRLDIVKAYSHGQASRRELFKWGLFTAAGAIAPIGGLSPFVRTSRADSSIPTGTVPSPGLVGIEFTQPMLRLEVLQPKPATCIEDPTGGPNMIVSSQLSGLGGSDGSRMSCQNAINVDPLLGGGTGPCEGRPPGKDWAHQYWTRFEPKVAYDVTQLGAHTNPNGNIPFKFHPSLPARKGRSRCGHSTAPSLPSSCSAATANRYCSGTTTACPLM